MEHEYIVVPRAWGPGTPASVEGWINNVMQLTLAAVIPKADIPPRATRVRDCELPRVLRRIEDLNPRIPELSRQQSERCLLGGQLLLRVKYVYDTRFELLWQ